MLNSYLEHKIAPWQEKGRWYHFFIESDGTTTSITTADINGCNISSNNKLVFPLGFHIINSTLDGDMSYTSSGDFTEPYKQYIFSSGKRALYLPKAASYTWVDLLVFGYFEESAAVMALNEE